MGHLIVLISVFIGAYLAPMGIDEQVREKYKDGRLYGGEISDDIADIVPYSDSAKPKRPSPEPPSE